MQTPVSLSPSRRILGFGFFALSLAVIVGCGGGGKEAKNQVTGKVTLDGKPVAGTVFFQFADNKESSSPISSTDGSYQIIDPPSGTAKVYVKGGLGGAGPQIGGKEVPKGSPELAKDVGGVSGGVPPPTKYGSPTTSGLTFDIKGGKQTYDIPLSP